MSRLGLPLLLVLAACSAAESSADESTGALEERDKLHAERIFAADNYTCAVLASGQLRCWGAAPGNGPATIMSALGPTEMGKLPGRVTSAGAGPGSLCAVVEGSSDFPDKIISIDDGHPVSVDARTKRGAVYCLGDSPWRYCTDPFGRDYSARQFERACRTEGASFISSPADDDARDTVAFASNADAAIYSTGAKVVFVKSGQPTVIETRGATDVTKVALSRKHACAAREDRVWCLDYSPADRAAWKEPQTIGLHKDAGKVLSIALIGDELCIATEKGAACAPAAGDSFEEAGKKANDHYVRVSSLPEGKPIDHIASNGTNVCAVTAGHVYCAQPVSEATPTRSRTFDEIEGIDDAIDVAVGADHACVVRKDKTVSCWGDNSKAQLGVPRAQVEHSDEPVDVGRR